MIVRERLAAIIDQVATSDVDIRLDVPDEVEAVVDSHAFDRIVSNLIANALSHGRPPVNVSASVPTAGFASRSKTAVPASRRIS